MYLMKYGKIRESINLYKVHYTLLQFNSIEQRKIILFIFNGNTKFSISHFVYKQMIFV